ncbi:nuclear transport factor 2 family protein [Larkinella humicola]|uniref:nuclear transport factor 2 family protein n=1 Tax=Larkinella humicola TaxID=2607654 RepID=UPI001781AF2D|nr:nuclear transport factor 2 family protein [Larkinella humicola]
MQIRAEIQALEADDAVEMNDDEPMLIGKAAIELALTKSMMKRRPGTTFSFETMEVFGDGNLVTETGKTITKGATGSVVSTGKYMAFLKNATANTAAFATSATKTKKRNKGLSPSHAAHPHCQSYFPGEPVFQGAGNGNGVSYISLYSASGSCH